MYFIVVNKFYFHIFSVTNCSNFPPSCCTYVIVSLILTSITARIKETLGQGSPIIIQSVSS